MKTPHRTLSLALFAAAIFGTTSAHSDTSKTFSFEDKDKFNVGPLHMYVESSRCIANPEAILSQFGTLETPRILEPKERAKAVVSPASGAGSECAGDGAARFTLRFFETTSGDEQAENNDSLNRTTSVTFTLGKNNILDIDNQGSGGFSIVDTGSKNTRQTQPSYAIDWQSLQAYRKDVVYSKKGQIEAVLQCMNPAHKVCKGTLRVASRGSEAITLARGAYNIPYNKVKSVSLSITRAGKPLLTREHIIASAGSSQEVSLSANPGGSSQALSLVTANIPTRTAAFQGAQFNLNVVNNSGLMISACLFQQSQQPGIYPVVWFSAPVQPGPGMRRTFAWSNNDYSFVWGFGFIQPGITFRPSQTFPGNLGQQVSFNPNVGFYGNSSAPQNILAINSDGQVSPGQSVIGIGLSGWPVYVAQAQPNMVTQFRPTSNRVYLFAGNCQNGQILDPYSIANTAEINFPGGQTQATATLQADGTWTVGGGF